MIGQNKNSEYLYRDNPLITKIKELEEAQLQIIAQYEDAEKRYGRTYSLCRALWEDLQYVRRQRRVLLVILGIIGMLYIATILLLVPVLS